MVALMSLAKLLEDRACGGGGGAARGEGEVAAGPDMADYLRDDVTNYRPRRDVEVCIGAVGIRGSCGVATTGPPLTVRS